MSNYYLDSYELGAYVFSKDPEKTIKKIEDVVKNHISSSSHITPDAVSVSIIPSLSSTVESLDGIIRPVHPWVLDNLSVTVSVKDPFSAKSVLQDLNNAVRKTHENLDYMKGDMVPAFLKFARPDETYFYADGWKDGTDLSFYTESSEEAGELLETFINDFGGRPDDLKNSFYVIDKEAILDANKEEEEEYDMN